MNPLSLLLKLLPSFLPLVAFVVAESLFGETVGIAVGTGLGLAEFVAFRIKDGKSDPFIILDTALLAVMGGISIALSDPVFYKLKPAVIEAVFAIPLAISAFSSGTWLMSQLTRSAKGLDFPDGAKAEFLKMARGLCVFLFLHAALTAAAAVWMSETAWAFVSTGLFALGAAVLVAVRLGKAFLMRGKRETAVEWLPVLDESGKAIGKAPRSLCHSGGERYLHPVVHVHILDSRGRILLQKRMKDKRVQPGKWDTAVGGHVSFGETIIQALERETMEELGLSDLKTELAARYIWETDLERELVFTHIARLERHDHEINGEVEETKFWTREEIEASSDLLTPNFLHEFTTILKKRLLP